MQMSSCYPSRLLKAGDLIGGSEMILTVEEVRQEQLGQGKNMETKPVLYFKEIEQGAVINKTNTAVLIRAWGDESESWIGRRLALFAENVPFGGEMVPGLRIRPEPVKPAPVPRVAAPASPFEGQPAEFTADEIPF